MKRHKKSPDVNLFIDTNIFLAFYHFSNDDLEELKKLLALIRTEKVNLILPEQVIDEFKRNRDNQISHGLKLLSDQRLNNQFPQFCKEYSEYNEMRKAIEDYDGARKRLLKRLQKDIEKNALKADAIIDELFDLATIIKTDDELYEDAVVRFNKGNPPGKDKSYGDAINWTALLKSAHDSEIKDIDIVTDDSDYASSLDPKKLKPFLENEWQEEIGGDAVLYKRLSDYFGEKFEEIKLADEYEKEHLIKALAESPNFRTTHRVIWELDQFSSFTKGQAEDILKAALTNSQVRQIKDDRDVRNFLQEIVTTNENVVDGKLLQEFSEAYAFEDDEDD
jgi:rRNA-processing protein FCF1